MFDKLLSFTKKVQDLADKPALDAATIKAQFDAAPEELRTYFNKLIDDLKSIGLGSEAISFTGDVNTLTTTGFYYSSTGGTNRPGGNGWIYVNALDPTYTHQLYVNAYNGDVYSRIQRSGTWLGWRILAYSPSYTDLALLSGFQNYGGGNDDNAGYTIDNTGFVHLRGCLKAGTSGQVAFTLPVGCRPLKTKSFPLSCNLSGAFANIYNNGQVVISFPAGYTWLYLDSCIFLAEQ